MTILEAAAKLRPGTAWNMHGDRLEQADDGAPRVEPPALIELQALVASDSYKILRRKEYPPVEDQLDAIWKGGEVAADMLIQVQAVKARYPRL